MERRIVRLQRFDYGLASACGISSLLSAIVPKAVDKGTGSFGIFLDLLATPLKGAPGPVSAEWSRLNYQHLDAEGRDLLCERLREAFHSEFGRVVVAHAWRSDQASYG